MSPEELEAMEASIPDWKKGALVVGENEEAPQEEKKGMFSKLKNKISGTESAKKFQESEEYEKIKEMRSNY